MQRIGWHFLPVESFRPTKAERGSYYKPERLMDALFTPPYNHNSTIGISESYTRSLRLQPNSNIRIGFGTSAPCAKGSMHIAFAPAEAYAPLPCHTYSNGTNI